MAQQDPDAAANWDFEVYRWLREFEEHFNGAQAEVKKLASAWMLAGFGAIGLVVRGDLASGLLASGPLLVLIGLGANIGMFSLWILDQKVNQRLLGAAFRVGLLLERSNPRLPPIRSLMWVNSGYRGVGRFIALFYAGPMALNAAAALYGLNVSPRNMWWSSLLVATLLASAALFAPFSQWLVARISRQEPEASAAIRETVDRWTRDREARAQSLD